MSTEGEAMNRRITLGDVIFWELCLAIGAAMACSIKYPAAGIVLGAAAMVFAIYIQWAGDQP